MSVIERIERGELSLQQQCEDGDICSADKEQAELLRLAKIGAESESEIKRLKARIADLEDDKFPDYHPADYAMQWTDGAPPVFGENERKWIIFEHLTPFTRATVYDTAVWLGKFYSEEKVKLARRWMELPLPPLPEVQK